VLPNVSVSGPVPPGRAERRRQRVIMVGLLLTLVGIGALWLAIPTDAGELTRGAPFLAIGAVGLWAGGLLLGFGGRSRRSRAAVP
jgi:hypothetical protein